MTTQADAGAGQSTTDELIDMIPALRVYARSLTRHAAESEDLVQETLVKALAAVERFQPGTNMRAWLFTIMRNSFLTDVKKRLREPVGAADCVSGSVVTFPNHDDRMANKRVMAAIRRLPHVFREVLVLHFLMNERYDEIARICNCPVGTVKSRINRARLAVMEDVGASKVEDMIPRKC